MKKQNKRGICALLAACVMLCAVPYARATRFADVPDSHWAAADIELCAHLGVMNGVTPTAFGLRQPLSRSSYMVILGRFFQWLPGDPDTLPYQDINPAAWYAPALAAAYRQGVMTDQAKLFRPDEPVTRGELAAALIRALGYSTLSGLTGPVPFADVSANAGYITLAYDMGLMQGNGGRFAPDDAATREQAAAILARLYRKLNAEPRKTGVISSSDGLWTSAGLESVAVQAGHLTGVQASPIQYRMEQENASSLRASIAAVGAKSLLYLSANVLQWNALTPTATAVFSGGYSGLLLELTGASVDASQIQSLQGLLQDRSLHLIVPAPDQTDDDYPYATLSQHCDSLTIRVLGQSRLINGFPSDPVEPLEEVYQALHTLFRSGDSGLDPAHCALLLSASGSSWSGAVNTGLISAQEVETLLRSDSVSCHYSERYACAYLRRAASDEQPEQVVWYLDAKSMASRVRLAKLFDLGGLVLADANGLTETILQVF